MRLFDSIKGLGAKHMLSRIIEKYGTIKKLDFNSSNKELHIIVLLHGESSEISISIDRYSITKRNGDSYVAAHQVKASRKWLQSLAEDLFLHKEYKIPSWLALIL